MVKLMLEVVLFLESMFVVLGLIFFSSLGYCFFILFWKIIFLIIIDIVVNNCLINLKVVVVDVIF